MPELIHIENSERWHVERGVPLVGIFTILLVFLGQTVTAAWYASKLDARVDVVERAIAISAPQGDRLTRVEVKLDTAIDSLKDVHRILSSKIPQSR